MIDAVILLLVILACRYDPAHATDRLTNTIRLRRHSLFDGDEPIVVQDILVPRSRRERDYLPGFTGANLPARRNAARVEPAGVGERLRSDGVVCGPGGDDQWAEPVHPTAITQQS